MSIETDPREWMEKAECREKDPGIFYPHDAGGVVAAREICKICEVKTVCLEYALTERIDHGVWGGTSERERRRMLRARR